MIFKKNKIQDLIADLDKNLEKALKNKKELSSVIDKLDEAVIILDNNLKITELNEKSTQLITRKREDSFGKSFFSLIHKSSFLIGIKLFDQVKLKRNFAGIFAFTSKSGYIAVQCEFIKSKKGFYFCILYPVEKPVSDTYKFVPVLKPENFLHINETFQALIDHSPAAILILDLNSYVLVWNEIAENVYGWKSKDAIGKLLPTLTEESFEEHLNIRNQLIEGKSFIDYEVERKRKDGSMLWLNLSISPIKNSNGEIFATMSIGIDITRRKLAEENLKKTELLYHDVVETAQDLIWRCDTDYRYTFLNPAWETVLGYKTEEMIGMKFSDFQNERYAKRDKKTFSTLLKINQFKGHETIYLRKDNNEVNLVINAKVMLDENLTLRGFCGTAYDITEKKKAEKSLRDSEKRLRSIYENSTIGIYRTTPGGDIIMVNPAGVKMLGYNSFEELAKRNLEQSGFDQSNPRKKFRERLDKEGSISGYESIWINKDGTPVHIRESANTIIDEDKNILFYDGTFEDITDQKLAEDALRKSEARLKLAQQIGNIGSLEIDLITKAVNCSSEMQKIFDVSASYFNSGIVSYLKAVHIEDIEIVKKGFEDALEKNIPFDADHRIILPGGNIKYLQIRSRIINDFNNTPVRYVIVIQDITERKRYEAELESARTKAEESNKLKTSFLQNMSHEIRTPMNGIMGFSNLLLDPELSNEEKTFYVKTINNSCFNLLNIINDVVEISKIETGIVQVFKSFFNLNHLMDELFQFFNYESAQKNIRLVIQKDRNDEKSIINSDEQKIRQILTNLIKNSLKFTEQGEIEFGYRIVDGEILFKVKDSGIGIDEKFHDIIFERFRQAESNSAKLYGGTGLGLTISKSLIEILGGKIWLESKPGNGSVFYFTIPVEANEYNKSFEKTKVMKHEAPNLSACTLLLAEDDKVNFYFMNELLLKTKAKILSAENGIEVLQMIEKNPHIDLIIMDIKMPYMDGLEATRELRKMNIKIPIIAVTAYALKEERKISLEAGCNDYLTKPIFIDEFYDKIAAQLILKK